MFYVILVTVIILGEWKIKNYMEKNYDLQKQTFIFNRKICLRKYHNKGAFLNFMETKRKFLHFLSVVFTLIISLLFLLTLFHKGNRVLKTGLALLLGGAFSNTYDRLKRNYVVDYFSFCTPNKKLNTIVFNLSDFCIILGSLISVLSS